MMARMMLRRLVMFGVELGGFMEVVLGMGMVGMRDMGVVAGLFVVAGFMGLGGGMMVPGGVLVVSGGFAVVLDFVFVRHSGGGLEGWTFGPQE